MKRLMFLTVFALSTSSMVVAQNYAGPVGIGTTTPQATLDVNGSQILRGNLSFAPDQTARYIYGSANGVRFGLESASYPFGR